MTTIRYNPNRPPAVVVHATQAITTNISGQASFGIPIRRVRKAIVGYMPITGRGGDSGDVRVCVKSLSGATVVVSAWQNSGSTLPVTSGYLLSGGVMTLWCQGDQ
jgi:hypothetical protein